MSDRSCDCCSEDDTFFGEFFKAFIICGTAVFMADTTFYLIHKTIKHSFEIEKLSSRLEECEKNRELKK